MRFTSTLRSRLRPRIASRVFGLMLLFLVFGPPTPSFAHNSIDGSVPADGAMVDAPLNEWVLTFTNDVPLDSASAEIIGQDGIRTSLPDPSHGDSLKVIRFVLPEDLSGAVSGRWRLVSTDGHIVSGRVQFTIEPTGSQDDPSMPGTSAVAPQESAGSITSGPAPEPFRWALRLSNYVAIIFLGGLLFAESQLAQGIIGLGRSALIAKASAIALAGVPAIQVPIFVADLNESSIAGSILRVGDAFAHTPGAMMIVRALSGGVFVYLIFQGVKATFSRNLIGLILFNGVCYLTALAYTGHSRSSSAPWIGIPIDVLHTAAVTVWMGGLIVLIAFIVPTVDTTKALAAFRRYGKWAQYAVLTIVGTGVVQTLRLHSGVTSLVTSPHGRLLLLKVCFVAAMLKVGDINRRRLTSVVASEGPSSDNRKTMIVRASITELSLGAIVIAVTAILVNSTFT